LITAWLIIALTLSVIEIWLMRHSNQFRRSLRTGEDHISRILDKKNLSNRVELALHVRERRPSD